MIDKSTDAINSGKTRGYSEYLEINNVPYFRQFAIKKINDGYYCYFFIIKTSDINSVDDYNDHESILVAESIEEAIDFFNKNGGSWGSFSAFKGISPI